MFFDSVCTKNGFIWFFDRESNALWKSEKDFTSIHYVSDVPYSLINKGFFFSNTLCHDNSLFVCNQYGMDIIEYNIEKEVYVKHKSPNENIERMQYRNLAHENYIIQIPEYWNGEISLFDLKTRNFNDIKCINGIDHIKIGLATINNGGDICITEKNKQNVYVININTMKLKKVIFPNTIHLGTAFYDGKSVYATSTSSNQVIVFDGYEFTNLNKKAEKCDEAFSTIIEKNESVFFLPRWGNGLFEYNRKHNVFNEYHIPTLEKILNKRKSLFLGVYTNDDRVFFLPWRYNKIFIFDSELKLWEEQDINILYTMDYLIGREINSENKIILSNFISGLE